MKLVHLEDQVLQRFQQNVADVVTPLQANALLNGNIATLTVSNATQAGTNITLSHGLGRPPIGIIPLAALQSAKFPSNAGWIRSATLGPNTSLYIILQCSADLQAGATFQFWVF